MKPDTSPPPLRRSWQARTLAWGFCISVVLLHFTSWATIFWFGKAAPWIAAFPVAVFILNMIAVFGWFRLISFRGYAYSPLGPYFPHLAPRIDLSATPFCSYASTLNAKLHAADWYLTEDGIVIHCEWRWLQLFIPWHQVSHVTKTLSWTEHWEVHHEAPDVTSPLGGSAEVMSAICQQLAAFQTGRSKDAGKQTSVPART